MQKTLAGLVLVMMVTAVVYLPSLSNQFLNFDDPENVLQDAAIRTVNADTLRTYFTKPLLGMYSPLVYVSFAVDYSFTGTAPGAYHVTNLLLHLLNIGLVGASVMMLTRSAASSVGVAALFAVSPINVAAVAPISVRSSLLYSCFYLAAYLSYLRYVRRSHGRWLWLALGFFVASLMSKSAAVVFPALLLLTDAFLGREDWKRCIREKIPFLALSVIGGLLGLWIRNDIAAIEGTFVFTALDRLLLAAYGACFYVVKLVAPVGLSPIYAYPLKVEGHLPWLFYLAPFALAAAAALVVRLRRNRLVVFCAGFFLVHLVLVLKLVPVGLEYTSDRYAYLPSIALFLLVVEAVRRHVPPALAGGALIVAVAAFSLQATARMSDWRDSLTLYTRVLERDPDNAFAHNNLGKALAAAGSHERAASHYAEAIRLQPDQGLPHLNLGELLASQGRWREAIHQYEQALTLNSSLTTAYGPLGLAYAEHGDLDRAVANLRKAVELSPQDGDAHNNLGVALDSQGRPAEAVAHYREAVRINPAWTAARRNLASALAGTGQVDEAVGVLIELVRSSPGLAEAHSDLGLLLARQHKPDEAIQELRKALQINSALTDLHYNLAILLAGQGRNRDALVALDEALRLNPNDQSARQLRDRLLIRR